MPSVQELYELWAADSALSNQLGRSLGPRSTESFFDDFAALEPQPGQLVLDVGARDGLHAIRLVRTHGVRAVVVDPIPLHCRLAQKAVSDAGLDDVVTVVEAAIEELPLEDESVDWIWCRDVLVHVDARRGLAECARVLRPGGAMLAYVTLATDRLEPLEERELLAASALRSESFHPASLEAAARDAGLALRSVEPLGSEWRERMLEEGTWDAATELLELGRLDRRRDEHAATYGESQLAVEWAGRVWGVYQMLGKLCPTVYVWEKHA
jgi:sarcosine/dimethylglycine N-methyltransferase